MTDLSSLIDVLSTRFAQEINAVRFELYSSIDQASGGNSSLFSGALLDGGGAVLSVNNLVLDGGAA